MTTAVQGGTHLGYASEPTLAVWAAGLVAIASGALLFIGFLTPGAGTLAGLSIAFIAMPWFPGPGAGLLMHGGGALCSAAVAIALVLIGPGSLSVDARLFGRREIVFPHHSHDPRS